MVWLTSLGDRKASPNIQLRKETGKQKREKREQMGIKKKEELEGGRGAFYVQADP